MENVKIVRTVSGDDVIGNVLYDEIKDEYFLEDPMLVYIKNKNGETSLILQHWLPVEIIKENEVLLKGKDVLTLLDPSDSLCEYYTVSVKKIKEQLIAKQKKKETELEDMVDILDALEESVFNTLH